MDETWVEEIGLFRLSCTSNEGLQKSLLYLKDMNVFHMPVPNLWKRPPDDFEPLPDGGISDSSTRGLVFMFCNLIFAILNRDYGSAPLCCVVVRHKASICCVVGTG